MIYIWEWIQILKDIINGFILKWILKKKEFTSLMCVILQRNISFIKKEWSHIYFQRINKKRQKYNGNKMEKI